MLDKGIIVSLKAEFETTYRTPALAPFPQGKHVLFLERERYAPALRTRSRKGWASFPIT